MTLLEEFKAIDDAGNEYTVRVWGTEVPHRTLDGRTTTLTGSHHYVLDGGGDVSPNKDGTFTIVDTEVVIRRIE